jgi:hypothetical protein
MKFIVADDFCSPREQVLTANPWDPSIHYLLCNPINDRFADSHQRSF